MAIQNAALVTRQSATPQAAPVRAPGVVGRSAMHCGARAGVLCCMSARGAATGTTAASVGAGCIRLFLVLAWALAAVAWSALPSSIYSFFNLHTHSCEGALQLSRPLPSLHTSCPYSCSRGVTVEFIAGHNCNGINCAIVAGVLTQNILCVHAQAAASTARVEGKKGRRKKNATATATAPTRRRADDNIGDRRHLRDLPGPDGEGPGHPQNLMRTLLPPQLHHCRSCQERSAMPHLPGTAAGVRTRTRTRAAHNVKLRDDDDVVCRAGLACTPATVAPAAPTSSRPRAPPSTPPGRRLHILPKLGRCRRRRRRGCPLVRSPRRAVYRARE